MKDSKIFQLLHEQMERSVYMIKQADRMFLNADVGRGYVIAHELNVEMLLFLKQQLFDELEVSEQLLLIDYANGLQKSEQLLDVYVGAFGEEYE